MEEICKGESPIAVPTINDVQATFGLLFSSISPDDCQASSIPAPDVDINMAVVPITVAEVGRMLKRLKSSAPGPDGVVSDDIKNIQIRDLTIVYNCFLWLGDLPKYLKSRTILISKTGDVTHDTNWHPISVS